ncbi:MAG TPA: hypothetical protein VGM84_21065 [Steroidobacteraceae bacterium]|jgi:hypothetical protein
MKQVTGSLMAMTVSMLIGCASNAPPGPAAHSGTAPADFKIPSGYRQAMINGQEKFCRKNVVTGSRVSNGEVCLTAAQIQAEQDESQKAIQGVQSAGARKSSCASGPMGAAPAC